MLAGHGVADRLLAHLPRTGGGGLRCFGADEHR